MVWSDEEWEDRGGCQMEEWMFGQVSGWVSKWVSELVCGVSELVCGINEWVSVTCTVLSQYLLFLRFERITKMKMMMLVFWVVTCGLVGRYQHFGGIYCLHLQDYRQYVPSKCWYLPTSPHSIKPNRSSLISVTSVLFTTLKWILVRNSRQ
jgi:hypothetical protein